MNKFLTFVSVLAFFVVSYTGQSDEKSLETLFVKNLKNTLVGKTWHTTIDSPATATKPPAESIHGKQAAMTCLDKGTSVECKVTMAGAAANTYELWVLTDNELDQEEFENGKSIAVYGATTKLTASSTVRDYYINCKDTARTECENGISGERYWHIEINAITQTFNYIVKGYLNPGDTTVQTRHTFSFTVN